MGISRSWVKCPYAKMRSKFGAALESGLIKPVEQTVGVERLAPRRSLPILLVLRLHLHHLVLLLRRHVLHRPLHTPHAPLRALHPPMPPCGPPMPPCAPPMPPCAPCIPEPPCVPGMLPCIPCAPCIQGLTPVHFSARLKPSP